MNRSFASISLLGMLLLLGSNAKAQDFTIDAEFRPRVEFREGFQKPLRTNQNPALITLNRTRLGFTYASERIRTKFTLQDSRVWGESNLKSNNIPISVFEGWVELLISPKISLTIGRQALSYDYNRLFASSSWTNNGSSHDLGLLKYTDNDLELRADLALAINNSGEVLQESLFNDNSKLYEWLGFARLEKKFAGIFKASAIFVGERFQDVRTDITLNDYIDGHLTRFTTGANIELNDKENPFSFIITGYYQFGNSITETKNLLTFYEYKDLSTYFLATKLSYNFTKPIAVYLGSDIYSGSETNSDKDNTWDKLYGSNHSYNGSMEYWRTIPNEGLVDIYGGTKVKLLDKKLTADLSYHLFSTQKEMSGATKNKDLGSEIDLKVQYKVMQNVALECGWSTYFATDNSDILKGIGTNTDTRFKQWAYISLTINPQLFTTNKQ